MYQSTHGVDTYTYITHHELKLTEHRKKYELKGYRRREEKEEGGERGGGRRKKGESGRARGKIKVLYLSRQTQGM